MLLALLFYSNSPDIFKLISARKCTGDELIVLNILVLHFLSIIHDVKGVH